MRGFCFNGNIVKYASSASTEKLSSAQALLKQILSRARALLQRKGYQVREFCFNVALLGGPGFARVLRERYVEPELRRAEPR